MRVRMLTRMAGPQGSAEPGAIVDLDRAEAFDMIERGCAEQVEDAIASPGETADAAPNRRRRRR
jgi:hypothetical protein